jgi:hypothetical protein
MRSYPFSLYIEEACELARVRCEDSRCGSFDWLQAERASATDAGSAASGACAVEEPEDAVRGSGVGDPVSSVASFGRTDDRARRFVIAPADLHGLESERLGGGQCSLRDRERHVAGVGAERGHRRETGCARHTGLAADD